MASKLLAHLSVALNIAAHSHLHVPGFLGSPFTPSLQPHCSDSRLSLPLLFTFFNDLLLSYSFECHISLRICSPMPQTRLCFLHLACSGPCLSWCDGILLIAQVSVFFSFCFPVLSLSYNIVNYQQSLLALSRTWPCNRGIISIRVIMAVSLI